MYGGWLRNSRVVSRISMPDCNYACFRILYCAAIVVCLRTATVRNKYLVHRTEGDKQKITDQVLNGPSIRNFINNTVMVMEKNL